MRVPASPLPFLTMAVALATVAGCTKSGGEGGTPADATVALDASGPFEGDASVLMKTADDGGDAGVMNATPLPAASIARMVNPDGLPPYSGATGSVEGTITVTGEPARDLPGPFGACDGAARLYAKAFREGPLPASAAKGSPRPLADAVVVVTGYTGYFLSEKREASEAVIEGCGYTARTVTMTFGQRLEVKNVSRDFWTPELDPPVSGVIMMSPPHGDPAKIYPKKPGHYLLLDHDRKFVNVDLYAFLHPLHAATDAWGHFRIDGLPVGTKLKVSAMHPHVNGNASTDVTVEPGVVKTVDLSITNAKQDAGAPVDAGKPVPKLH